MGERLEEARVFPAIQWGHADDSKEDSPIGNMPVAIIKAIWFVQKDLRPLVRSSDNDEFGSKFTPLSEVMTQALDRLNKRGVIVMQSPCITHDGFPAFKTTLAHKDGATYTEVTKLAVFDGTTPQSHASAITYMRRYQLMAMLGLTSEDDDDDGNKGSAALGKVTREQRNTLTSLLRHLKWTPDMIAGELRNIRTRDHAATAILNYQKQHAMKGREREAEESALEATDVPIITEETGEPTVEQRLKAFGLRKAAENKLVHGTTGKPFISKCTPDELYELGKSIAQFESGKRKIPDDWYAAGRPSTMESEGEQVIAPIEEAA